jgi:glycosyltransferase involved in cell wall biosynthesis
MQAKRGNSRQNDGRRSAGAPLLHAPPRPEIRRVLMTADTVGGVWQYSLDLATAFRDRGIETTLAVMGPPIEADQWQDALERGVAVAEGHYKLEWAESPWEDVLRAGEWLLELAARVRPDIVHLNGFAHAALSWNSPVVVVAHSCVRSWWRAVHGVAAPPEWDRYTGSVIEGLRAAQLVIAPSRAMLSMLEDEYGMWGPSRVIANGRVSVDRMSDSLPLKSDVVLGAGRLWDEAKNLTALAEIAPELSWRVVLAGDCGGREHLARTSNMTCLGRLDSASMARWYARAAIYALPALYEPFGLSVLEAAASGCALVLGDIPTLRENWSGAAVFVAPRDRRALLAAIQGLIDDPAGRERLAMAAMARARQFTVARMTDAYLDAYRTVVAEAVV